MGGEKSEQAEKQTFMLQTSATARSRFLSDRQRLEYLFALYEKLAVPLLPAAKKGRRRTSPQPGRPDH